jgi:hypothetical protein
MRQQLGILHSLCRLEHFVSFKYGGLVSEELSLYFTTQQGKVK